MFFVARIGVSSCEISNGGENDALKKQIVVEKL